MPCIFNSIPERVDYDLQEANCYAKCVTVRYRWRHSVAKKQCQPRRDILNEYNIPAHLTCPSLVANDKLKVYAFMSPVLSDVGWKCLFRDRIEILGNDCHLRYSQQGSSKLYTYILVFVIYESRIK